MDLPATVTICEVGPRDGFQMEPEFIPTEMARIDRRPDVNYSALVPNEKA
jgi:hypothetical protein